MPGHGVRPGTHQPSRRWNTRSNSRLCPDRAELGRIAPHTNLGLSRPVKRPQYFSGSTDSRLSSRATRMPEIEVSGNKSSARGVLSQKVSGNKSSSRGVLSQNANSAGGVLSQNKHQPHAKRTDGPFVQYG